MKKKEVRGGAFESTAQGGEVWGSRRGEKVNGIGD